jgi:hypothetical protein
MCVCLCVCVCVLLGTRYLAFLALLFYVFLSQPVHYPFERNSVIKDTFGGKLFFCVSMSRVSHLSQRGLSGSCSAHGTALCEVFART